MNDLRIFSNEHFGEVRVVEFNGEPLFNANDVCRSLGYSNARDAISKHVDVEDVAKCDTLTDGGIQFMTYVNESGLYSLILRSKLKDAKIFKRWITSDVLPSIRRDGGYMVAKVDETPEEIFARAVLLAQETIKRREQRIAELEGKVMLDAPKVEFYDDVVKSKDAIDMQSVAKVLNMGIGRNKLFEFLRYEKVLMWNNVPYQSYVDKGWFRCIESKYTKPNGDICINIKTVVLQRGVDGIRKMLKSKI